MTKPKTRTGRTEEGIWVCRIDSTSLYTPNAGNLTIGQLVNE